MTTFQDRISELFFEAKNDNPRLNQNNFALKFGASRSQLKGWLSGAGEPSTSMLKVIAQKCGVSVDWLIGNTNIRTPVDEIIKNANPAHVRLNNSFFNIPEAINEELALSSLSPEESILLQQYRIMEGYQKEIIQKFTGTLISVSKIDKIESAD